MTERQRDREAERQRHRETQTDKTDMAEGHRQRQRQRPRQKTENEPMLHGSAPAAVAPDEMPARLQLNQGFRKVSEEHTKSQNKKPDCD